MFVPQIFRKVRFIYRTFNVEIYRSWSFVEKKISKSSVKNRVQELLRLIQTNLYAKLKSICFSKFSCLTFFLNPYFNKIFVDERFLWPSLIQIIFSNILHKSSLQEENWIISFHYRFNRKYVNELPPFCLWIYLGFHLKSVKECEIFEISSLGWVDIGFIEYSNELDNFFQINYNRIKFLKDLKVHFNQRLTWKKYCAIWMPPKP